MPGASMRNSSRRWPHSPSTQQRKRQKKRPQPLLRRKKKKIKRKKRGRTGLKHLHPHKETLIIKNLQIITKRIHRHLRMAAPTSLPIKAVDRANKSREVMKKIVVEINNHLQIVRLTMAIGKEMIKTLEETVMENNLAIKERLKAEVWESKMHLAILIEKSLIKNLTKVPLNNTLESASLKQRLMKKINKLKIDKYFK